MMNKLIIQSACQSQADILTMVMPCHADYCKRHGYEYRTHFQKVGCAQKWRGHWAKMYRVQEALKELADGDFILYMDNDAVIVDHAHDIEAALQGHDLGLVQSNLQVQLYYGKFDVGVMLVRVTPETRELFDAVVTAGPLPPPNAWNDKRVFNQELYHWGGKFISLDSRYNDYKGPARRPTQPSVIRAWHGEPEFHTRFKIKGIINAHVRKSARPVI